MNDRDLISYLLCGIIVSIIIFIIVKLWQVILIIGIITAIIIASYYFMKPNDTKNENKEINNDGFTKGRIFEDYVLQLFPPENFNIVHKTVGKNELDGRFTEDCIFPDYKFRDLSEGRTFWVECKYRTRPSENGSVEWCTEKHFQRYKEIRNQTQTKTFILLGIGNETSDPERLILIDLDRINYTRLFKKSCDILEISKTPFHSLNEIYWTAKENHDKMN